jgi:hypothetical protein
MKESFEPKAVEGRKNEMISRINKRIDVIRNDAEKLKNYTDRAIVFIMSTDGEIIPSEKIAHVVLEIIYKEFLPEANLSELDPENISEFTNMIDRIILHNSKKDSSETLQANKEPEPALES